MDPKGYYGNFLLAHWNDETSLRMRDGRCFWDQFASGKLFGRILKCRESYFLIHGASKLGGSFNGTSKGPTHLLAGHPRNSQLLRGWEGPGEGLKPFDSYYWIITVTPWFLKN